MARPRSTPIPHLLVLGVLGLGCDEPAKAPAPSAPAPESKTTPADPTIPTSPAVPAKAPIDGTDPSGISVVSFVVEAPQQLTPLAATAEVTLTRDAADHTRVFMKAACRIGDSTHVDTYDDLLIGETVKRGATVKLDERFFGGRMYREGDVLGDCDVWLSVRVVIPETGGQYREYPLDARCLRGGTVLDQGCAPTPTVTAAKPLMAASVDLSILRTEVVPSNRTDSGHLLDFVVELTGKDAVGPRWDLEGDVKCQGGGRSTHRHENLLGVDLQELGPGQKGRNDFSSYAKAEETLDVPPQQCELTITGTRHRDDPVISLGTWCYAPDQPLRASACPAGGA